MTYPSWVALQGMAHSFIELDKAVVHVIRLIGFLWLWFSVCLSSDGEWWSLLKLPGGRGQELIGKAMLSKLLIQFSVYVWSCVPSLLHTWAQTMVKVMKIMVTFLKRSHAYSAILNAPNPAASHHRPTPLLKTPWHPQASLGQSPAGLLLLSSEPWCKRFCCAFWESISQSCVSSGSSMVGLMATPSKRAYAIPKSATPRASVPVADHPQPVPPQETLKHSSVSVSMGFRVLVHTRFVWALRVSLAGMGFDSKCEFASPTILVGLLLYPWMWCISHSCSNAYCHTGVSLTWT